MQLYLDCDGVLADFDLHFIHLFGLTSSEYEEEHGSKNFWSSIRDHGTFFEDLPLMKDAKLLFNEVSKISIPKILTGCPYGGWAEPQKLKWAAQHFPGTEMITCMSRDKRNFCKPGDILIDDTLKYRHLWEEVGGIFIHHTSAKKSLKDLHEYLTYTSILLN